MLANDTWDHGVGKATRKWAKGKKRILIVLFSNPSLVGGVSSYIKAATLSKLVEMMTRGLTKVEMNYAASIHDLNWRSYYLLMVLRSVTFSLGP